MAPIRLKPVSNIAVSGARMTTRILPLRLGVPAVLLVTLLGAIPLTASQTPIPPGPGELQETIDGVIEEGDETVRFIDPTNGTLPTFSTLETTSILAGLGEKLDTFAGLVESGALPSIPLTSVDLEDIRINEGFLPNHTLVQGTNLLGDVLSLLLGDPVACITASPSGGTVSTTFTFDASCSTDIQTATRDLETRWDWSGDGGYDTSWGTSLSVTHSYSSTGIKNPTVQVRDEDGNTATASVSVQVSAPPDACFTVSPSSGTTATTFHVDAACSSDDFTPTSSLRVRWDWTNDGTYDTSFTTAKTATHKYSSAGTHTIKLQAQDTSGLTDTTTRSVSVTFSNGGGGCPSGSMSLTQPMSGGSSTPPPEPCTGATQSASASTEGCEDPLDESSPCGVPLPNLVGTMSVTPGGYLVDQLKDEVDATSAVLWGELNRTSIAEPILFQRMPNAPYEPAQEGEAWLAEGASLRLRPAAPPVSALIDQEWLEEAFGTYGSPSPYTIVFHDGRAHASVTDPGILLGSKYAFEAIVLGQSTRYTSGHADMVELTERGMLISFTSYPGFVTTTVAREAPNGTVEEQNTTYHEDRLGIDFVGENTTGQTVRLSKEWLDGLGLTMPRFVHEDGSIVPHVLDGVHYVLSPLHFSTIFAENFDSGAAQGWSLTGLWHVTTACVSSYNGAYHLAYNQDSTCTYNTGATTSGTATFDVNLAGVSSPQLNFRHRWTIESYAGTFDVMRVQISTNGGSTWSTLQQWDSGDGDPNSASYHQGTWTFQSYSLSAYTGGPAKIRFSFDSGDAQFNSFLGWLVDDVKVTGTTSDNPPDACFSVSPSSGTTNTAFQVDAGCSTDTETPAISLQVRWDWENDGVYDTAWTTDKTADHTYGSTGSKTIKLEVKDGAGLTDTFTRTVSVSQGTVQEGLEEDFEGGTPGWSLSGLWRRISCRSAEGTYSLAYNQGSCSQPPNYNVGTTTGSAVSPLFKVPANLPVLRLQSWYESEGGTTYDQKFIEISTDGGSSWTTLEQVKGEMRTWSERVLSLDEYAGKNAQIRFRFNSVDGVLNQYQGWYIDQVEVVTDNAEVIHTSGWYHSSVEGSGATSHSHHDGSVEVGWKFQGTDDSVRQTFSFPEQPTTGGTAYLWVYASAYNCSGAAENTMELVYNNQVLGQFAPCAMWSTQYFHWNYFSFPTSLLQQGSNAFQIRGVCSCSEGIWIATDDSSGTNTDLVVDNTLRSGYEAFWELVLYYPEEFETLERYTTITRTNDDGSKSSETIQEAFVFLDPQKLKSLYLMQRKHDDGLKTYMAAHVFFEKRAEYNSGTHKSGWSHQVAQPENWFSGGSAFTSPSTGAFYTWFRIEWQTLTRNDDGTSSRAQGRYLMLNPSAPNDPADKQGQGQNPTTYAASGSKSKLIFDLDYDVGFEITSNKHPPVPDPQHTHEWWKIAVNVGDFDKRVKNLGHAGEFVEVLWTIIKGVSEGKGFTEIVLKGMRITLIGVVTGWVFTFAQTGDVFRFEQREFDRKLFKIGSAQYYSPWTIGYYQPPSPVPFIDPQVPIHALNINTNWALSETWEDLIITF